jgi:hypothetical protein
VKIFSSRARITALSLAATLLLSACGDNGSINGSGLSGPGPTGQTAVPLEANPGKDELQARLIQFPMFNLSQRAVGHVRETELVSKDSSGNVGDKNCLNPVVSADGRYVAFVCASTNLVTGFTLPSNINQVYRKDNVTGTVELVSRVGTTPANKSCLNPSISDDGRYIVFNTGATNVGGGTSGAQSHVYVWDDTNPGVLTLVDMKDGSTAFADRSNGTSFSTKQAISGDGQFVVFDSAGTNLLTSTDANAARDIFVRDLVNDATYRINRPNNSPDSEASSASTSNQGALTLLDGSVTPAEYAIAYTTNATNLADKTSSTFNDILVAVWDTDNNVTTTRASRSTGGGDPDGSSSVPTVSTDGVAFESVATNLVTPTPSATSHCFYAQFNGTGTEMVDVSSAGARATAAGNLPWISDNGRLVAFQSSDNTLVSGDTGNNDVFVRDRLLGLTYRASQTSNPAFGSTTGNQQAAGNCNEPGFSKGGDYTVFRSNAKNLVPTAATISVNIFMREHRDLVVFSSNEPTLNGGKSEYDAFIKDLTTGELRDLTTVGDRNSREVTISPNGRFVCFTSQATNLPVPGTHVSNASFSAADVYLYDVENDTLSRASAVNGTDDGGNSTSSWGTATDDGSLVLFTSRATNLATADTPSAFANVYVRNTATDVTSLVSRSPVNPGAENGDSSAAMIAAGTNQAVFQTAASNFFATDANGSQTDIVKVDMTGPTFTLVSVSSAGVQGNNRSREADISRDGHLISYNSFATNLVTGDTNGQPDVFTRNTTTSTTSRVSISTLSAQGNNSSIISWPSTASDATYVGFCSVANTLLGPGVDTNGVSDAFVRLLSLSQTSRPSVGNPVVVTDPPVQLDDTTDQVSVGTGGTFIAFESQATNVDPISLPGDAIGACSDNVYVRVNGKTVIVNLTP